VREDTEMQTLNKQAGVQLLRRIGLLPAAESVRFVIDYIIHARCNVGELLKNRNYRFPPSWLAYDAYATTCYTKYMHSGRKAADAIYNYMARVAPERDPRICEWGCGPGRIIRSLALKQWSGTARLHGCDYNQKTIDWCCRALPEIEFKLNELHPPLPYRDNEFDWLYCVSVFTHLSEELHYLWLRELIRVTKPGGHILLTVHGDKFISKLTPSELVAYRAGGFVTRENVKEGSRIFTAFQSPSFMSGKLFKSVEIVAHDEHPVPEISGGQDVWIVRK
jgi:SAM-dependent methyltransferase